MTDKWIFGIYKPNELQNWAQRLKYFRFVFDPQINSGKEDSLELKLSYTSPQQYLSHLQKLGITPQKLQADCFEPKIGQAYSQNDVDKFQFEIEDVKGYRQTKILKLQNEHVFLWAERGKLRIQISGPYYCPCEIYEDEIRSAENIEGLFESVKDYIIDPPVDTIHCVCPKYYPQWFIY